MRLIVALARSMLGCDIFEKNITPVKSPESNCSARQFSQLTAQRRALQTKPLDIAETETAGQIGELEQFATRPIIVGLGARL
jgi:hypothetical protein